MPRTGQVQAATPGGGLDRCSAEPVNPRAPCRGHVRHETTISGMPANFNAGEVGLRSRPFRGTGFYSKVVRDLRIASTSAARSRTWCWKRVGDADAKAADHRRNRPEEAVLEGVRLILADAGRGFGDVACLCTATTLATNAVDRTARRAHGASGHRGFPRHPRYRQRKPLRPVRLNIEKPNRWCRARCASPCPKRMDVHAKVAAGARRRRRARARRATSRRRHREPRRGLMHSYVIRRTSAHARDPEAELPDLWLTLSSEVCPRGGSMSAPRPGGQCLCPAAEDSYLERMQTLSSPEKFAGTIYLVTSGGASPPNRDSAPLSRATRRIRSGRRRDFCGASRGPCRRSAALSYDMGGHHGQDLPNRDYKPHTAAGSRSIAQPASSRARPAGARCR